MVVELSACITLPDNQTVTTYAGICEHFRDYFRDLFTTEQGLNLAHVDVYLADFPCLVVTFQSNLAPNEAGWP